MSTSPLIGLLLLSSAPATNATGANDRVAVIAVGTAETLSNEQHAEIERRLADGLERAGLELAPGATSPQRGSLAACTTDECIREIGTTRAAGFVVVMELQVRDRDYDLVATLHDGGDGRELARTSDACTICGIGEVADLAGDRGHALGQKIRGLLATAPLSVTSRPSDAAVSIDGVWVGATPWSGRVSAGHHRVVVHAADHVEGARELDSVAGVAEHVDLALVRRSAPMLRPATPATHGDRKPGRRLVAGSIVLGGGIAAVGAAIPLFLIHGNTIASRCDGLDVDWAGQCRYVYATRPGAIVASALGVAAIAGGVALVVHATRRARAHRKARR